MRGLCGGGAGGKRRKAVSIGACSPGSAGISAGEFLFERPTGKGAGAPRWKRLPSLPRFATANTFSPMNPTELEPSLPGEELVEAGLADLAQDRVTDCSLLVLIAAPRLRGLGIEIPVRTAQTPHEHQLYTRIEERLGAAAHSHYNSLIRRIVSYARALEQEQGRKQNLPPP